MGGDPQHEHAVYRYSLHMFALGVMNEEKIDWYMLSAQQATVSKNAQSFDLGRFIYLTERVVDIPLYVSKANRIGYDEFFGRGCLDSHLVDKKILLIGTGAIGSFLAETLVRGGIRNITLADGDSVEAGNLCRASYEMDAVGNSKADALCKKLQCISPFCDVKTLGCWQENRFFAEDFENGAFYGNINYDGQEKFLKKMNQYDLIFDCTASNELLHFLSYAVKKSIQLISVCITNHAQDCVLVSNQSGNVFEQRKHLLAKIEQDTDNFYTEGTGCYAPTFLATASDMLPFTNLVVRKINKSLASNMPILSTIWSYQKDSIIADRIYTYTIENGTIQLIVSQSVLEAISHCPVCDDGEIGLLMGGYSSDCTLVFVTHVVKMHNLPQEMRKIKTVSEGILDYVGNACVSGIGERHFKMLRQIAHDDGVNTNNPLLAELNKDGTVSFSLMIDDELVPFVVN